MRCSVCGHYRHGSWFGKEDCTCTEPVFEALDNDPGDETDMMFQVCLNCHEAPAVDDQGLCGHCHWLIAAQIQTGLRQFEKFLERYAGWSEYQAQNGLI